MKTSVNRTRRGFSLVELLAVVLVLAVLAAVAVPLYTSQRRSAAGRACKANLTAISASLSGYALRNNAYPATLATLVGTAEGLTAVPTCPLGGAYTYADGTLAGSKDLECPNDAAHAGYGGIAGDWERTLAAPAGDSLP
jgi:type IV pilus assembly protein PilA